MDLFIPGVALLLIGVVAYFADKRKPVWFFVSGTGFGLLIALVYFYVSIRKAFEGLP